MCIRDRPRAGTARTPRRDAGRCGGTRVLDPGHVVAGLGLDLDAVADVDEERDLDDGPGLQRGGLVAAAGGRVAAQTLSLIHISEPTRLLSISYGVFCLKKTNTLAPSYFDYKTFIAMLGMKMLFL